MTADIKNEIIRFFVERMNDNTEAGPNLNLMFKLKYYGENEATFEKFISWIIGEPESDDIEGIKQMVVDGCTNYLDNAATIIDLYRSE